MYNKTRLEIKAVFFGGIPKWLKGLASNTSRSAVPAQGFKSLFLRFCRIPLPAGYDTSLQEAVFSYVKMVWAVRRFLLQMKGS